MKGLLSNLNTRILKLIEQFEKGKKTYTSKDIKVIIDGKEIVESVEIEIENPDYMFMGHNLTAKLNGLEKDEDETDQEFKKRLIEKLETSKLKGVNDDR